MDHPDKIKAYLQAVVDTAATISMCMGYIEK
jgi:hypothetical protein